MKFSFPSMDLLVVLCGFPFQSHDHTVYCLCSPSLSRWAGFQKPQAPWASSASPGMSTSRPIPAWAPEAPQPQEARPSLHTCFPVTCFQSVPSRRAFCLQHRGRNQSHFLRASEPMLALLVKPTGLGVSKKRQEERVLEDQNISLERETR